MRSIFEQVLYIGPDIAVKGRGGISSVMRLYSECINPFNYLRTNSANGTIYGLLALIKTLLILPFYRWFRNLKIVHIHGAAGKSFVRKTVIIKLAKILGYKIVFHCHSGYFKDYVEKVGREKICAILSDCDAIVALSNGWKKYFEEDLGFKNVYVVNNIVYKVDVYKENNKNNKLQVLFLGLICDNKGIFDLIDVLAEHKKEFENKIELQIGGAGEDERLQRIILERELTKIVKPLGWVLGEHKNEIIRNCDVFILPSYVEGVPISILEAMANRKAIIASTIGGIPEIVENMRSGILHNPGDKVAIYNALKFFMDNPEKCVEYGLVGYKIVESYYPQSVIKQLKYLYSNMLETINH